MTALPPSEDFTGQLVTQSQFKTALSSMRSYLAGLFGVDGTINTARNQLGINAATAALFGTIVAGREPDYATLVARISNYATGDYVVVFQDENVDATIKPSTMYRKDAGPVWTLIQNFDKLRVELNASTGASNINIAATYDVPPANINAQKWIRGSAIIAGNPADGIFSNWVDAFTEAKARSKRLEFAGNWTLSAGGLLVTNGLCLQGHGSGTTKLTLASGVNADIFKSQNFDALTGQNKWKIADGVNHGMRFSGFTLDCNKENNTSGRGVVLYAKRFVFEDFIIRGTAGDSVYTECGAGGGQDNYTDLPETSIDVFITESGGRGWTMRGPHDAVFRKLIIGSSQKRGLSVEASATYDGACDITFAHVYSNGQGLVAGEQQGIYSVTHLNADHIISESQLHGTTEGVGWEVAGNSSGVAEVNCVLYEAYYNKQHGLLLTGDNAQFSAVKIFDTYGGGGVKITGRRCHVHGEVFSKVATAAVGVEIDADGSQFSGKIRDYSGGTALKLHSTAQRSLIRVDVEVFNCLNMWNNGLGGAATGGNQYNIRGSVFDPIGSVFSGVGPNADGSENWQVNSRLNGLIRNSRYVFLSANVPVDALGNTSLTFNWTGAGAHGLIAAPRLRDIKLSVQANGALDFTLTPRLIGVGASTFTVSARVSEASATPGATATVIAAVQL